jgi:hypothetical protein
MTNARGEFSIRIPKGPSRTLRVSYVASDVEAVASTDIVVAAQITARALHTRVRNGKSVVFRGRVIGPIPAGGLLVSLEAHEPGRWVPVATTRRRVRTSATGTFTLRYRFRRTFRPTNYRFRVVTDEDSAFPYTRCEPINDDPRTPVTRQAWGRPAMLAPDAGSGGGSSDGGDAGVRGSRAGV